MHPIGVITTILQALRQFFLLFVVAFFGGDGAGSGAWIQAGLLVVAVGYGVGRWWRLRYWFEDSAMRVSDGFLFHREIFLEADKVQAVDIRAGIVQRIFDVVRVQIKSGATGTQVDLTALSRNEAERIQRLLDPEGWLTDPVKTGDGPPVQRQGSPLVERRPDSTPWSLNSRELIALGATSGQLGVIASAMAWVFSQTRISTWLEENIEALTGSALGLAPILGPIVVGLVVVGVLVLTWTLSIAGTAFAWGDFAVVRHKDRVVVSRGLLERREISVQRDRIQAITVVEELLHQPLGRCAVYVESIGHAEDRGVSTCLHPYLRLDDLPELLEDIAPGFHGTPAMHRPPSRALPRFLVSPSVTIIVLSAAAYALWQTIGLAVLLLLPPTWLLYYLSWRDTGVGIHGNTVVVRSRGATRRTAFVPRSRIQTADLDANIFQRWRSVANFSVVAASGATGRVYLARDLDEMLPPQLLQWAGRRASPPQPPTMVSGS